MGVRRAGAAAAARVGPSRTVNAGKMNARLRCLEILLDFVRVTPSERMGADIAVTILLALVDVASVVRMAAVEVRFLVQRVCVRYLVELVELCAGSESSVS